jgi:uncharacterized protein YeeX (DUF496 family)
MVMEIKNLRSSIDVSELFQSINTLWMQDCGNDDLIFHVQQILFAVFLNQIIELKKDVQHPKIWWMDKNNILNYFTAIKPIEDLETFHTNLFKKVKRLLSDNNINNELARSIKDEATKLFPIGNEIWYLRNISANLKDQLSNNFIEKMIVSILNLKDNWDHLIKKFKNNKNGTPGRNKHNKVFY